MLRASEALLVFIGTPSSTLSVDRVRLMKGMFLLGKDGPREFRGLYTFSHDAFGPFATEIYQDLERLETQKLVRSEFMPGGQQTFEATGQGGQRMRELIKQLEPGSREALVKIKRIVTSMGVIQLLRYIHGRYPDVCQSESRVR